MVSATLESCRMSHLSMDILDTSGSSLESTTTWSVCQRSSAPMYLTAVKRPSAKCSQSWYSSRIFSQLLGRLMMKIRGSSPRCSLLLRRLATPSRVGTPSMLKSCLPKVYSACSLNTLLPARPALSHIHFMVRQCSTGREISSRRSFCQGSGVSKLGLRVAKVSLASWISLMADMSLLESASLYASVSELAAWILSTKALMSMVLSFFWSRMS